jgi:hypothetical protein
VLFEYLGVGNTAVLFAELMRSLTACVYVCEGNSLEEVSLVTQFYKFVITHSLIASDVQKVFRFDDRISFNGELPYSCCRVSVHDALGLMKHIDLFPRAHKVPIIVHKVNTESSKVKFFHNRHC